MRELKAAWKLIWVCMESRLLSTILIFTAKRTVRLLAPGEKTHTYRLAGSTCLAGDIIGDYSFDEPLLAGKALEFQNMTIYTMVKNNTFNGMKLPDIVLEEENGDCRMILVFFIEFFCSYTQYNIRSNKDKENYLSQY